MAIFLTLPLVEGLSCRLGCLQRKRGGMFTIGEFSRMTGLTVKTFGFYHEEGLLVPVRVDGQTGYRYYEARQIELARVITYTRDGTAPGGDPADPGAGG